MLLYQWNYVHEHVNVQNIFGRIRKILEIGINEE